MAVEIVLPRVDMDMERGKLTHWFAKEGEQVVKGQALFEIETDKAAMEVEAPASGVLRGVAAQPGETHPVGVVIGWICGEGEDAPPRTAEPVVAAAVIANAAPAPAVLADAAPASGLRATPKARALARRLGLDLRGVTGGGPRGRIQARDFDAAPARVLHREWLQRGERTPLVLVHGFGADLNGWRRWLGHLPRGRGALALDLPGHGRSPLTAPISLDAFADALAATLAQEGLPAAHLVAHSLGAAAAVVLAGRAPRLVRSLTLLAPAGFGPDINRAFVNGFLNARSPASLAPWLAELTVDPAALGTGLAETTLAQRDALGLAETQRQVADALFPEGTQAYSARAALARYSGPVQIVFGVEDRIVPASHARGLPGGVGVHLLAGVGHLPHWEARALVAAIVADNAAAGDERP